MTIKNNFSVETLAAVQKIGQFNAFNLMNKMTDVGLIKIAIELKESNSYKGLPFIDKDGNDRLSVNWDDVCKYILKTSKSSIDEKILNFKKFGEDFMLAADEMGLGSRDMRKLRKFDEDEITEVCDKAIAEGDKETVTAFIENITAKKEQEKQKLTEEIKERDTQLEVIRDINTDKNREIDQLKEQLSTKQIATHDWQSEVKEALETITALKVKALSAQDQLSQIHRQLFDGYQNINPQAYNLIVQAFLSEVKQVAEETALLWLNCETDFEAHLNDIKPSIEVLEMLAQSAAAE
ncbi:MAG: hypothetical protein COB35_04900 [Gammaproteobacteria bacterium]|nr:MAG: hypothetical protein COB35_04900 [Gammaproteobacteria bacterium]